MMKLGFGLGLARSQAPEYPPTGNVPIFDAPESGLVTITIESPPERAGEYTFDAADLADGPVNLIPPDYTGTASEGNTVTYVPGVWVYDVDHGPIVQAAEWYQAGVPTSDYDEDRTVTAQDDDIGLSIVETASNAAGSRSAETIVIADTFVQNGFETANGNLAFTDPISANVTSTLLIFTSYVAGAGAGRIIHITDNTFVGEGGLTITASDAGQWDYQSFGVADGDRVNMLCAVDVPNESIQIILQVNDGAPTLVEDKEPGKIDVDLGEGEFILLNNAAGTAQFSGVHHRTALWVGGTLPNMDVPAEAARLFWHEDGSAKNPLVSVYDVGTPLIDVYGTAAQATANTINTGSLGAFDTVTGSFVAVVPAAPTSTVPASILSNASVGTTLAVTAGTWTGYPEPTLTYQWKLDGVDVPGETGTSYTTDTAGTVSVVETATNSEGTASQASNDSTISAATPADETLVSTYGGVLFAGSRSTIYSDTAATTLAAADGPVGAVASAVGASMAAPADGNRPLLREGGGNRWLETVNATDVLMTGDISAGATPQQMTRVAALRFPAGTVTNRIWSQVAQSPGSALFRGQVISPGRAKMELDPGDFSTSAASAPGGETWAVVTQMFDANTGGSPVTKLRIYVDGTQVAADDTLDASALTFSPNFFVSLGASTGGVSGQDGTMFAYFLVVPKWLDDTDRGVIEALALAEIPA